MTRRTVPDAQTYFTLAEAADYLRVGKTWLKAKIADGRLSGKKLNGAKNAPLRFHRDDLDAFFKELTDA